MCVRPFLLRGHKRRIVHQVTETKQQVAGGFIVVAAAEGKVAGCTRRWEIAHANLASASS